MLMLMLMLLKLRANGVYFSRSFTSRSLIYYSTSISTACKTNSMADFLVKSVGFSEKEAISTSSKVTDLRSIKHPDAVIDFLKQVGFSNSQIKTIVFSSPTILSTSVDKSLKPKIKVFQDSGFSGSQLADLLCATPIVLLWPLVSHLKPALDVLKTLYKDNEDLIKAVKKSQWMLSANVVKYLQLNVVLLQGYGLSEEAIKKQLSIQPRQLLQRPEWLKDVISRVEELGIPRDSPMFVHGIEVLASLKQETLESKFVVFESYGFTRADILAMARKLPFCLRTSETKIRTQLDFFLKKLGYGPAFVVKYPNMLKFSMEKRVVPRIRVLQALRYQKLMDANCGLATALHLSESLFVDKFVLPFREKAPDIYQDYMKSTSCPGPGRA